MSVLVGKNPGDINIRGGGMIFVEECNQDGTNLTSPDTWHLLGIIKTFKMSDKAPFEAFKSEDGFTYYSPGTRAVENDLVFLDRSVAMRLLTPQTMLNRFYRVLTQDSIDLIYDPATAANVYAYTYFPITMWSPETEWSRPGTEIGAKMMALPIPGTSIANSTWSGVTGVKSVMFTASTPTITVTAATNPYYSVYTSIS